MKSGFIAILGRPNVGKSSLMNALVGEKVSIVSPKAQTTRDKILGIYTTEEYQMIFVDTPGVHKPKNELGEYMEKCVKGSTVDVDGIVIVFDISKKIYDSDIQFVEKYLMGKAPVFLILNKTDLVGYDKVYPVLNKLSYLLKSDGKRNALKEIIPTSAHNKKNIDTLREFLANQLPEGEMYFPEDEITDKTERYMITEIIREKALYYLNDEIPHGIGVYLQSMSYDEFGTAKIECDIIAEKDTHKSIIIGKKGEKLKQIGQKARIDIEKLLDCKVYLQLFVKVRDNWRNNALTMNDIGYNIKGKN